VGINCSKKSKIFEWFSGKIGDVIEIEQKMEGKK